MSKETILEAAAQIFSEKGFHAASMQDIARSVNLQKASLYHHVSSKQEILLELLDRALDILIEQIGPIVAQASSPEIKLQLAMQAYLQILTDQRGLSAVLLFEHRSLSDELQSRHLPRRDRFEGLWRSLIREGVNAGIFVCEDPAQATRSLLGVMNWTLTWYRADGPLTAREIADQYASLFLNGLLKRAQQGCKNQKS
jgi:TetR/AcrR family transcriptional regulator, cholesterol catabolism regulator